MHPHLQKAVIFFSVVLFIASWSSFLSQNLPSGHFGEESKNASLENPIYNSTLGYQAVYALALPDRLDRVQPLLRAANATNINVTLLDAVRDKQIPKDAWPNGWGENRDPKEGELGCLISHVRTWKKIVAEKITSALVMESDSDWDMRIKDIMAPMGDGIKTLVDWPFNTTLERTGGIPEGTLSPYGDNWDIIWMGHCGSYNYGDGRIWRFNDTSVPPEDYEFRFGGVPGDDQHVPGTRMVYSLRGGVCSTAYAISYQGAVKLVKYFQNNGDNIDLALGWFCDHMIDMACVGVWPQVITAAASHSNIVHPDGEIAQNAEDEKVHPGPSLQYSARVNAQKAMQGLGQDHWQPEWKSTWVMKNDKWTLVTFDEYKVIKDVEAMEKMNSTVTER